MFTVILLFDVLLGGLFPSEAFAWGYQTHRIAGPIADQLLEPNAGKPVEKLDCRSLRGEPDQIPRTNGWPGL